MAKPPRPTLPVGTARPTRGSAAAPQAQANHHVQLHQWQGPLPPPGALREFDDVLPGSAERIVRMVELEQAERHQHEQKRLDAAIRSQGLGKWMGFGLGVLCVVAAVASAWLGAHPTVSIAIVSVPVMATIRAFFGKK